MRVGAPRAPDTKFPCSSSRAASCETSKLIDQCTQLDLSLHSTIITDMKNSCCEKGNKVIITSDEFTYFLFHKRAKQNRLIFALVEYSINDKETPSIFAVFKEVQTRSHSFILYVAQCRGVNRRENISAVLWLPPQGHTSKV